MTEPEELRERAASIFQQLRNQPHVADDYEPSTGEDVASSTGEDVASSALPGTAEDGAEDTGTDSDPADHVDLTRPSAPENGDPGLSNPVVTDSAVAQPSSVLLGMTTVPDLPEARVTSDPDAGAKGGTVPAEVTPTVPRRSVQASALGEGGVGFALSGAELSALSPERERESGTRRHPGSDRPLPRVLAIANQKGGVGKTTTAVNLGATLAELGYRVLVVDLDPQGNATTGLGVNPRNLDASVYDVILHETPIEDCIEPSSLRNLFIVPATIDLAGAEIELVPAFSRELRLRRAIDSVKDDFEFILIDCPPSLGLLTVNGLAAASEVVVPIQCEYYALEGLGQLLRNVNLVKSNLNPNLEVTTIILTMFDARTRLAEQVVDEVRSHFGDRVCRHIVPRTVRLSEAPSFGQPIIVFDSSSRGAIAYRELAKEVSGGAPQRIG
ncbi:MAG TPA: AAA family ATPase [Acidimicrobiales bacterium]|jgi:chromosome partitioning protein|nr:AAA family ATPase [Acidimicrobiales bacterium]